MPRYINFNKPPFDEEPLVSLSIGDHRIPPPMDVCEYYDMIDDVIENKEHLIRYIKDNPVLAVDIETSRRDGKKISRGDGIKWRTDILSCISVSNGKHTIVIKCSHFEPELFKWFVEALAQVAWVGHNIKFDCRFFLRDYGVIPRYVFDTEIAAKCLECVAGKRYNLLSVAEEHLGIILSKEEQISNWGGILITNSQIAYSAKDAYYSYNLYVVLKNKLNACHKRDQSNNINSPYVKLFGVHHKIFHLEMETLYVFTLMEENGVFLDAHALAAYKNQIPKILHDLLTALYASAGGQVVNPNSPAQIKTKINELYKPVLHLLQEAGFEGPAVQRIEGFDKAFKGPGLIEESITDANPLDKELELLKITAVELKSLVQMEHVEQGDLKAFLNKGLDFLDALYQYKQVTGNLQRIKEFSELIQPKNNRIYTSFRTWGAVSGRTSNPKPNLQNVKSKTRAGINLRSLFTAPEGKDLIVSDYGQIQLVIIAALTEDPVMMDVLINGPAKGLDLHKMTASAINNVPPEEVTSLQRKGAKSINFGYCLAPETLIVTEVGEIPIKDVTKGMKVLTHTGKWRPVTKVFSRIVDRMTTLVTSDGTSVRCSEDHPWLAYSPTNKDLCWTQTKDLVFHSRIVSNPYAGTNGSPIVYVVSLQCEEGSFIVHDLTVEEDHSFIANGLVSHNCFGMGAVSFVEYAYLIFDLVYTVKEAANLRNIFFSTYKKIKDWHEDVKVSRRSMMYPCRSFYGRNMSARNFTNATNYPVQATEGDIMKLAMVLIHQKLESEGLLPYVKCVNMIHDELVHETVKEVSQHALDIINEQMIRAANIVLKNKVPVTVDSKICKSWAEKG